MDEPEASATVFPLSNLTASVGLAISPSDRSGSAGSMPMQIINPLVQRDIEAGKGLRLNLGSGQRPRPGFYSLDCLPLDGVDIVADLNEPLHLLSDNSVEEIYSHHTFEH